MASSLHRLAVLERLFSPTVLGELAKRGNSPTFARLVRESLLLEALPSDASVGDAFDYAFQSMNDVGNRGDYVFRARIVQNILLGRHSLRTASLLSEFRVAESKADLVLLNGTAVAFEIKSDRDNLKRLAQQVDDYRSAFSSVYVVTGESHIDSVLALVPDDVGLMRLNRSGSLSTIRTARDVPERVSSVRIFESIRAREASTLLENLGLPVPKVPNSERHLAMKKVFANIDSIQVHSAMVQTLKASRSLKAYGGQIASLPVSLRGGALGLRAGLQALDNLIGATKITVHEALGWG